MTDSNVKELRRLCQALERLEKSTEPRSSKREALRKAGFALHLAFFDGRRAEIELLYQNPPLTEKQREQLRRCGIDPDA